MSFPLLIVVIDVEGVFGDIDAANEFHVVLCFSCYKKRMWFLHACSHPDSYAFRRCNSDAVELSAVKCKKAAGIIMLDELSCFRGCSDLAPAAHIHYQRKIQKQT